MKCSQTGRRLGVFQAWERIRSTQDIPADFREYLNGLYGLFNETLPVPKLQESG